MEVSEEVNGTEAYTFDKFESRIETMFYIYTIALLNVFIDAEKRQRIRDIAPAFFQYTEHPVVPKAKTHKSVALATFSIIVS